MVTHETYRAADGRWLLPSEVERRDNSLFEISGGPVTVGRVEKMSKSKKNTVDPSPILDQYGADAVRWFVLSDSPAERDLQWTEAGIEGAWRFVQRVWRLVNETKDDAGKSDAGEDDALTRAAHIAIDGITADIEALRFNKAVAKSYELAAAIEKAAPSSARRHAVKMLVQLVSPAMPHLAEEAWEALGEAGLAVDAAWPEADPAMLAQDTVTIAIQVNGKLRDEVEAAKGATREDMEALVLTREKVQRALDGKTPRKVIVVPDRLVNIVA